MEVRSPQRKLMPDTVGLKDCERTSLRGIAKRAQACKDHRFRDLCRELNAELLHTCWGDLNKNAASGVDRVAAQAYEQDLDANPQDVAGHLISSRAAPALRLPRIRAVLGPGDRRGDLRVMKRTARKKLQSAKQRIEGWIKANRHLPGRQFIQQLNRKLVGHYHNYGLRSNEKALHSFYQWTIGCAYKCLNRRGGKRRSFTWARFNAALKVLEAAWPTTTETARAHVAFT